MVLALLGEEPLLVEEVVLAEEPLVVEVAEPRPLVAEALLAEAEVPLPPPPPLLPPSASLPSLPPPPPHGASLPLRGQS